MLKREALYFAALFVLPCLALIGLDLATTESALPLRERLCTFEDVCVYGQCYFLPAFLYVGARILALLMP